MKTALLAFLLILVPAFATAQHPILPDFQADPSARVFHGRLYVYPSHDIAGSKGWDMVDWHVFSTDDMVHWRDHGVIFSLNDITWAKRYAWAPDCIERNGKYYFYFPADDQIGVAVGDSPTGPFKDALGKPLIARNEVGIRSIDPAVFIDDDGQAYLYFGNSSGRVGVVKLKSDMITLDGPIQVLDLPHYHEGIWVHKHKGLYYFSYPSNRGDLVANLMEYSTAKGPMGPFHYQGIILDNRSRNVHGSITEFKGKWYLFFHVAGPSAYERRVCVERLRYNKDGTIRPIQLSTAKAKVSDEGSNPEPK
jgi:beta-xylosidase